MKNVITLIFGYKDRDITRVKRCFDSLAIQSLMDFKVVFVDYGSNLHYSKSIKKLIQSYTFCKYIYNYSEGHVWNRSHALNIGIRSADTNYIMTSDIDLIFSNDFIKNLLKNIKPNIEFHSSAFSLPKNFNNWSKLKNKPTNFTKRETTALGLCQVIQKEKIISIGGFDEFYRIWGVEDQDLNSRLKSLGCETKWLNLYDFPIYHQWHESSGLRTRTNIPKGWQRLMENYKLEKKNVNVRNNKLWGYKQLKSDRFIFDEFRFNFKNVFLNNLPSLSIQGFIFRYLSKMKTGQGIVFIYEDSKKDLFDNSKLNKIITLINSFSNKFNLPVLLENDLEYFGAYENIYNYRDQIYYFLINFKSEYTDYFFSMNKQKLELKIIR